MLADEEQGETDKDIRTGRIYQIGGQANQTGVGDVAAIRKSGT